MSEPRPLEELDKAIAGTLVMLRELLIERSAAAAKVGIYYCTACHRNLVTPTDGEDTCGECLKRMYG